MVEIIFWNKVVFNQCKLESLNQSFALENSIGSFIRCRYDANVNGYSVSKTVVKMLIKTNGNRWTDEGSVVCGHWQDFSIICFSGNWMKWYLILLQQAGRGRIYVADCRSTTMIFKLFESTKVNLPKPKHVCLLLLFPAVLVLPSDYHGTG